jgi:hypothetical protein
VPIALMGLSDLVAAGDPASGALEQGHR